MKKSIQAITVNILGKEYKIMCEQNESENLIRSSNELDANMRKIRDSGKVATTERIAVMAALNLMHELYQLRKQTQQPFEQTSNKLQLLYKKIENALSDC